jgi:murein lipoprotein
MLIKHIALAALIITATGCANTENLDASVSRLNQKVDTLINKVNALTDEVAESKRLQQANSKSVESVKSSIDSTNERMDNIVSSYKK